jgi:acyl-CoA synthetase (AMP-forming)/AMP-acid ligase II
LQTVVNHCFNVKVKDLVIRDHETINFEIKYTSEIANDFIDFYHLSTKGRDKISELLSQELKSLIKWGNMNFIRKKLKSLVTPKEIEYMDKLPRTRSKKLIRRRLHAKEWGEEIGDISTLEND